MTNVNLTLPAQMSVLFVLEYPSDYNPAKTRGFKLILFRTIIYLKLFVILVLQILNLFLPFIFAFIRQLELLQSCLKSVNCLKFLAL